MNSSGGVAQAVSNMRPMANGQRPQHAKEKSSCFQMPLHYPRHSRAEYETMPEWKLDCLLTAYGLPVTGDVNYKRKFAMGAFLWH